MCYIRRTDQQDLIFHLCPGLHLQEVKGHPRGGLGYILSSSRKTQRNRASDCAEIEVKYHLPECFTDMNINIECVCSFSLPYETEGLNMLIQLWFINNLPRNKSANAV